MLNRRNAASRPRPPQRHDFYTVMRVGKAPKPQVDPLALHLRDGDNAAYATWVIATPTLAQAEKLRGFVNTYQKKYNRAPRTDWTWHNKQLQIDWNLAPPEDREATEAPEAPEAPEATEAPDAWSVRGWSTEALHRFCAYHWMNLMVMDLKEDADSAITMIEIEPSPEATVVRLQQMMRM